MHSLALHNHPYPGDDFYELQYYQDCKIAKTKIAIIQEHFNNGTQAQYTPPFGMEAWAVKVLSRSHAMAAEDFEHPFNGLPVDSSANAKEQGNQRAAGNLEHPLGAAGKPGEPRGLTGYALKTF